LGRRSAGAKKAVTTAIGGFIGCGINHVVDPLLQHFGLPPIPADATPFITGFLGVLCGAAFDVVAEKIHSRQEQKSAEKREEEVRLKVKSLVQSLNISVADKQLRAADADELGGQLNKSFFEWEGKLLTVDEIDTIVNQIYGEYRKRAGLPMPKRVGRKKGPP
jgi:hypothetical protein